MRELSQWVNYEANKCSSEVTDKKVAPQIPPIRELVVYQKEVAPKPIHIPTAIGEISYTPETGEVLINGTSRRITRRRRPLWQKFYTSPGERFSTKDLQQLYDPKGYRVGLDSGYMQTVVSRLRQDLGDTTGEIIQTDRHIGYLFASPEGEESYDDWRSYKTTVGEVKYDPKTFRVVVNNGKPITLTPDMRPLWEKIIEVPGKIVPANILFAVPKKDVHLKHMLMYRMKKRIGEGIILDSDGLGYALSVPTDEKSKVQYTPATREVVVDNSKPVKLSLSESLVWERLVAHPGECFDKEALVTFSTKNGPTKVAVCVSIIQRLRSKLGDVEKRIIKNEPGKGYYLDN